MKLLFLGIAVCASVFVNAQDITVHDPVMIKHHNTYYLFCTGQGISVFSSTDRKEWKHEKPVFGQPPQWAVDAVPEFKGHIWAPDIIYHNGLYHLYYSVSAFAKNTSCIGVATSPTLDPTDKNFKWTDHGKVIQSVPGRDFWNAIDPAVAVDDAGTPWMAFGSFWGGIKLVKLTSDLKAVAQPEVWQTVAKRSRDFKTHDYDPGEGAVEAPFIFRKGGFYYLFISLDYCCRGANSTYKVTVGRSATIDGPYFDQQGIRLDQGGGTLVVAGDKYYAGVGHNAAYTFDGKDYLVFHAYDIAQQGKPKLKIKEIIWTNGWPTVMME